MYLLLYIACAIAGFGAVLTFSLGAYLHKERAFVWYAVLISSLVLLVMADGMHAFNVYTGADDAVCAQWIYVRIAVTALAQFMFAAALPFCAAAFIRKRLPRRVMALSGAAGLGLAALSTATSLMDLAPLVFVDDIILLLMIAAGIAAVMRSFRTVPARLASFMLASAFFHAAAITANFVYIFMKAPADRFQSGLIVYFLVWNIFNILAFIFIIMRHPDNKVIVREDLEAADFTPTEKQITALVCEGRSNRYIADLFGISVHTVKQHTKSIYRKTGAKKRAGLIAMFGHRAEKDDTKK